MIRDSNSPAGMEGITGQVMVLGAVNAHRHVSKHALNISRFLARYNIHRDDYIVQVGFNSHLFFKEVGFLEEITISSATVPSPDDLPDLLEGLGKILSPFPGIFCIKDDTHPTPLFDEGGEIWDYASIPKKWSPLLSRADIDANAILQQHLQVSSPHFRDDHTSRRCVSHAGGSRFGGSGDPGPSRRATGKERATEQDEDESAKSIYSGVGNIDNGHNHRDEAIPSVHFDVSARFQIPDAAPYNCPSDIFQITGTISIPKAAAQAQKLQVNFEELDFQGLSNREESNYTQSYARVAIDAGHQITRTKVNHPHKTAASTEQEVVTVTREMGLNIGIPDATRTLNLFKMFFQAIQALLAALISWKGTEEVTRTRIMPRIKNFHDRGVAWWAFEVKDQYLGEHGTRLHDSNLPSVDFAYLGKERPKIPEHFDVEVAAFWSMPPPNKWNWRGSQQCRILPYCNLCQVVVLSIPQKPVTSLYHTEHITADVGPSGEVFIVEQHPKLKTLEGRTLIEDVQDFVTL